MSYAVAGQNKHYKHTGYAVDHPIIPHGVSPRYHAIFAKCECSSLVQVSVAVTAPAVFKFTGPSNPERHLAAAETFGVDISQARAEDAGEILSEALQKFLLELGDQPRGIKALGYNNSDISSLVEGTIPQRRVLMLAPKLNDDVEPQRDELAQLFEDAMEY